jgi:hypothetical protein
MHIKQGPYAIMHVGIVCMRGWKHMHVLSHPSQHPGGLNYNISLTLQKRCARGINSLSCAGMCHMFATMLFEEKRQFLISSLSIQLSLEPWHSKWLE